MLRDFEIRRWIDKEGFAVDGRLEDVSVNDLPDRRVWFVPELGFIKQFAADAGNRYAREVFTLSSDIPGLARPKLLASEDFGKRGSLLLLEPAPGRILDQVYLDLTAIEYEELAKILGRSLGLLHSSDLPGRSGAWDSPLPQARLDDRLNFDVFVGDLSSAGKLSAEEADGLKLGMATFPGPAELKDRWEESNEGWIHGDVHNENVFYEKTDSGPLLTFIDFEEASVAPVELDLVHPFLNILGEAFPGREFGDERGPDHPILQAFFSSYSASGPKPLGLVDVGPYAVAWYLGIARDANAAGIPVSEFYLRTALAVASLLRWVPPRNENGAP